jgi:AcrR family transcriptional regulator
MMPTQTFFNLEENKKNKIIDAIIDEMTTNTYEYLNLANIIRNASIPRGSFYQYFKDRSDLFDFMFLYIGQKKAEFFGSLMSIETDMPFLDRFLELYRLGMKFAKSNPKLFLVGRKMIESPYYHQNDLTKKASIRAMNMFAQLIEKDQNLGIIRKEIDAHLLAKMMLEYMINFSIEEMLKESFDIEKVMDAVTQLIDILKKGITTHV